MIYMNSEVISDYNKINRKRKLVKKKNVSIENTRFAEYENYYTQKIKIYQEFSLSLTRKENKK